MNDVTPLKLAAGVNTTVVPPGAIVTVPPTGCVTAVNERVSPGSVVSFASTESEMAPESSATVTASSVAMGGALPAGTVTVTVVDDVPPLPSEICR